MEQTKIVSLIEALVNIAIGFAINLVANLFVLPAFGFRVSVGQAFHIGLVFTVISVVRSYCVRRWFNSRLQRLAGAMATRIEVRQ